MEYKLSKKYEDQRFMDMIMGPNPVKLCEELMVGSGFPAGSRIMDLGSGQGLTSAFLAKEYGLMVYACDLWSEPEEHIPFFQSMGLYDDVIRPVKADANDLKFPDEFFDGVVSVDSYNYFGRDRNYLDEKLLPFVKSGGELRFAIPGMKKECHEDLPPELLLSWTPEQLEYMHDVNWWQDMVRAARGCDVLQVREMESNEEVWADWLRQNNEYAVGDRASMDAGAGKYLNFISIVLRKK